MRFGAGAVFKNNKDNMITMVLFFFSFFFIDLFMKVNVWWVQIKYNTPSVCIYKKRADSLMKSIVTWKAWYSLPLKVKGEPAYNKISHVSVPQ